MGVFVKLTLSHWAYFCNFNLNDNGNTAIAEENDLLMRQLIDPSHLPHLHLIMLQIMSLKLEINYL